MKNMSLLIVFMVVLQIALFAGNSVFNPNVLESANKSGVAKITVENIAQKYDLGQNYPNPFNPETKIKFVIGSEEFVTLTVYNIIGQEIETIISGNMEPGEYEVTFDGSNLSNGVYLYKLTAGSFTETKRMVLMK